MRLESETILRLSCPGNHFFPFHSDLLLLCINIVEITVHFQEMELSFIYPRDLKFCYLFL